jgi:hypothetical protein
MVKHETMDVMAPALSSLQGPRTLIRLQETKLLTRQEVDALRTVEKLLFKMFFFFKNECLDPVSFGSLLLGFPRRQIPRQIPFMVVPIMVFC